MFNHGKFNKGRFNLPGQEVTEYIIRDIWASDFEAGLKIGEDIRYSVNQSGTAHSRAAVVVQTEAEIHGAEEISARAGLFADYIFRLESGNILNAHVKPALNIAIVTTLADELRAREKLGEDISIAEELSGIARCLLKLGALCTSPPLDFEGTVYSIISTAIFDTYTVYVNVSIPAGGKLVIDSDNYIVLLNNANAIDKHSGAWLTLDRKVEKIEINPHGASIEATMLYTERFL